MRKVGVARVFVRGSSLLLITTFSFFISGCTPSMSADDAKLSVNTFGEFAVAGQNFSVGYEVDVEDRRAGVEYEVRLSASAADGSETRLHTALFAGDIDEALKIALPEPGVYDLGVAIAREGSEENWVASESVSITVVDSAELDGVIVNVPDLWLVGEPYTPEGLLSGIPQPESITTVLQMKRGGGWVNLSPAQGEGASITETEEARRVIRLEFFSGQYPLAQSDEVEIWFATPQAMVQEFFYEAKGLDDEKYYDFWIKHTYPGFLLEEKLNKDAYLEKIEEYGRRSTDPLVETVRERPNFVVKEDFLDYFDCLQSPAPGEVLPGKHFIFDYQTPYTLVIGNSVVGGGLERNSRHITFLDGRAYIYEGHC